MIAHQSSIVFSCFRVFVSVSLRSIPGKARVHERVQSLRAWRALRRHAILRRECRGYGDAGGDSWGGLGGGCSGAYVRARCRRRPFSLSIFFSFFCHLDGGFNPREMFEDYHPI